MTDVKNPFGLCPKGYEVFDGLLTNVSVKIAIMKKGPMRRRD